MKMLKFVYLFIISIFKLFVVLFLLFLCLMEWKGNFLILVILMMICKNLYLN